VTRVISVATFEVRSLSQHHCFATWDRVLLIIWRREVTPEGVEILRRIGKAFVQDAKTPLVCLTIVESTSPPPNEKVRGPFSAFHRDVAPSMREQIVVAEGSGFRSALVRSIGIALSIISPNSLPFKFVSGIDEASVLIRPHLSPAAGGIDGLKRALGELRDKLR
jgi:hypothetical protein